MSDGTLTDGLTQLACARIFHRYTFEKCQVTVGQTRCLRHWLFRSRFRRILGSGRRLRRCTRQGHTEHSIILYPACFRRSASSRVIPHLTKLVNTERLQALNRFEHVYHHAVRQVRELQAEQGGGTIAAEAPEQILGGLTRDHDGMIHVQEEAQRR